MMTINNSNNPIPELISDELFQLLNSKGLLNEKIIRDHSIRNYFKALRAKKMSSGEAIETIRNSYPYLQFDTIRKIVYKVKTSK